MTQESISKQEMSVILEHWGKRKDAIINHQHEARLYIFILEGLPDKTGTPKLFQGTYDKTENRAWVYKYGNDLPI